MDNIQPRANTLAETAGRMLGGVLARDDLHLMPDRISRAAYGRALRGLRAIEAFARRMFLMLALAYEHGLTVDMSERPVRAKRSDHRSQAHSGFRVFESGRIFPADRGAAFPDARAPSAPNPFIIYARTQRLRELLKDPAARARRLAFVLARRRHGPLLAPDPGETLRAFGTEASALFEGLGARITADSRARPPPKGPRPRPPPRIRQM